MIGRLIIHDTDSFKYFDTSIVNVCFFSFSMKQVCVCGLVSSYRVNTETIEYVINDCTGVLNARLYTSDPNKLFHFYDCVINRTEGYVKIIGILRQFNGEVWVNVQNIEPVFDMDIVTEHFLSCIASYLYYKKKGGVIDDL